MGTETSERIENTVLSRLAESRPAIMARSALVRVDAGAGLIQPGVSAGGFWFPVRGVMATVATTDDGSTTMLRLSGSTEMAGAIPAFTRLGVGMGLIAVTAG